MKLSYRCENRKTAENFIFKIKKYAFVGMILGQFGTTMSLVCPVIVMMDIKSSNIGIKSGQIYNKDAYCSENYFLVQ